MKFTVKNLGLIDEAEVKLDGITVMTGKNNVGKSTIGRMLYCVNNVLVKENIEYIRRSGIKHAISSYLKKNEFIDLTLHIDENNLMNDLGKDENAMIDFLSGMFSAAYGNLKNDPFLSETGDNFLKMCEQNDDDEREQLASRLKTEIECFLKSNRTNELVEMLLSLALKNNFGKKIGNVYNESDETKVRLQVEDEEFSIRLTMSDIASDLSKPFNLEEAIYIDSPQVAEKTESTSIKQNDRNIFDSKQRILNILALESDMTSWDEKGIEEDFGRILITMNKFVKGSLQRKKLQRIQFEYEEDNHKFDLNNVSTGVKTFAILKKLITNGKLKRNGLLILDEPEIHLHPDWQLVFAEILVLLQKQLNLKILINTHSVHFLMALEEYSKGHKIKEKCNYYLVERKGNHSSCKDVTENLNEIYQHFANSLDRLENLRWHDEE